MAPRKTISKDAKKLARAGKQVKSQAKQVKKTIKTIGKTFSAVKKALSRSKPKSKQSKSSKKSPKKSIPKKPPIVKRSQLPSVIKLKNIKQFQGREWASIVNDRELLAKLDKLKKPGDYFVGSVFGSNTHKFFRTGAEVIDQLNQYVDAYRGDEQKMIDSFTIATMQGQPTDYARQVEERIKENKRVALQEREIFGEVFGKTNAKGKTKTFRDYAKDAVSALNEAKKERDAAKKRADKQDKIIADLLKRLTAVEKRSKSSTKKASKKNATKRSTNNKGSRGAVGTKGKSTKPVSKKRGSGKASGKGKAKTASATKPKTGTRSKPNGNTRQNTRSTSTRGGSKKRTVKKAAKKTNNRRK